MDQVLILLGSASDGELGKNIREFLVEFGISPHLTVASAHRSPNRVIRLVEDSQADVFIAVAGLSAALPGVVAAHTTRPVIGVPAGGKVNLDAMLSVLQMPPGIPVAAVGLDNARNAALLAVEILALKVPALNEKLVEYRQRLEEGVLKSAQELESS